MNKVTKTYMNAYKQTNVIIR